MICQAYEGCRGTGLLTDLSDSGSGAMVYCDCAAGAERMRQDRERLTGHPEPTYKLCPHCGEPVEAALFEGHVLGCDGSIPARGEPIGNVKEYLDRELGGPWPEDLEDHESVSDRAERLADRHLRYDGSERGRR